MPAANNLEVEVKFLVEDLEGIRQKLHDAGAVLVRPRIYERNVRFDTPDNALLGEEKLLRLRQDTAVTLTFKSPSELDLESEAKIRQEIEAKVDDFDRMATIIEQLGFEPKQTYEKYREAYLLDDLEIVLDEMPYGNFIELEGNEQAIKDTAERFSLDWQERILSNYLAMMGILAEKYNLPFQDVTFENFRGREISFRDILSIVNDQ